MDTNQSRSTWPVRPEQHVNFVFLLCSGQHIFAPIFEGLFFFIMFGLRRAANSGPLRVEKSLAALLIPKTDLYCLTVTGNGMLLFHFGFSLADD